MTVLFILIYLLSFTILLIMCYKENKHCIYKVGDLLDEIKFFMWCPILNTLTLITIVISIVLMKLWTLSKLDILWKNFRNIKLK